jgi:hypothetical protein
MSLAVETDSKSRRHVPAERKAYSINEFTSVTGLPRSTYYQLVARGALAPVHVFGKALIPVEQVETLLRDGAAKARSALDV